MKLFKLIIISVILLLTTTNNVVAQNSGGINNFEIYSPYLTNGKLIINGNTTSTTFTYRVQFYKVLNSFWTPSNGAPKWLFTTINVKISSPNSSNQPVFYGNDNFVTLSDFPSGDNAFVWKDFSITITNSSLATGKPIYLAYISSGMPSAGVYSKSYQWQLDPPPVVIPPSYPPREGSLIRTSDLKVYSIMDGEARHIENGATLAGVYDYSGNLTNSELRASEILGAPITGNTSLLRDNNDEKLYFREGLYLRHIVSGPVANKYYFRIHNNSSNIVTVNGLNGYTVGPPIQ